MVNIRKMLGREIKSSSLFKRRGYREGMTQVGFHDQWV